jgi:type I restriction-modification system DNA methylase subunit
MFLFDIKKILIQISMNRHNMNVNEWINFLWTLHNKVRNAKGLKLTGMSALNEICNYLLLFFVEKFVDKEQLPEYCKISYLYNEYCTKQSYAEDKKKPYPADRNSYKLWERIYNVNNKDEDCVLRCLINDEELGKYLNCMTHRPSSYAYKSEPYESIQDCIKYIYETLKDVEWSHENYDMFGTAFEQFKEDAADKKVMGQHFTAPSIKNYIIGELNPRYTDTFYEPCAGSGGFIHTATSYVYSNGGEKKSNRFKKNIYANECEPELTKPLNINMLLHNVPVDNIHEQDSLDYDANCKLYLHKFDKIATNPPFGMKITHNYLDVKDYIEYWKPLITGKKIIKDSTAQFILHILNSLKEKDGHAGIVIDRGFLNNGSDKKNGWETKFRKYVLSNYNLYKVVLLPTGIFTYTNFATAIIFVKTGEITEKVDFYQGRFEDPNNKKSKLTTGDEPELSVSIEDMQKDWSLKYDLDPEENAEEKKGDCWVNLGDVCELKRGQIITQNKIIKGIYPVIGGGRKENAYHNEYNREENTIVISQSGSYAGYVNKYKLKVWASDCFSVQGKDDNICNEYLYYNLKIRQNEIHMLKHGQGQPHVNCEDMKKYSFPLLPIDHQEEIVKFLDKVFEDLKIDDFTGQIGKSDVFQLLIDKNYEAFHEIVFLVKQKLIYEKIIIDMEKEKKIIFKQELSKVNNEERRLGDLAEINIGGTPSTKKQEYWGGDNIWIQVSELNDNIIIDSSKKITNDGIKNSSVKLIKKGSILMSFKLSVGKLGIAGCDLFCNEAIAFFQNLKGINDKYLYQFLKIADFKKLLNGQIGNGSMNKTTLNLINIKLPSLDDQELIVKKIEEINNTQHHFQQHQQIIENALNYALETITNFSSFESSDDPRHDIDDCDNEICDDEQNQEECIGDDIDDCDSEICDDEQNQEECIGDDIDDNNEINNCDSEICDDEQNEEECIGDDIDEDISQFSENEEEQPQLITKNKSKVLKGKIDNKSSDKIVKKNKSKFLKGKIDNESSDKIVKKKMKKKTHNDTNEEFPPTKKIKNGELSDKIKKIKVIKKNPLNGEKKITVTKKKL